MRLQNTSRYPTDEVRRLVEFAMRGVCTTGVAVHVKNASCALRGRAYSSVPYLSPRYMQSSVQRLVTLGVGTAEHFPHSNLVNGRRQVWEGPKAEIPPQYAEGYTYSSRRVGGVVRWRIYEPVEHPYGGKSSPLIVVNNWQEALVAVAAHEARHIHQFRHRKPLSEVDCERFAAKRLAEFRALT